MCGFFGHGFYWEKEKVELAIPTDFTVVFDFEINSHSEIREYRTIPGTAVRIGFDPVNGQAVSNDNLELPIAVKEKVALLFQMYFPNLETITQWIKNNYGKRGDEEEWNRKLLDMVSDKGRGLFSKQYYTQLAQDSTQLAQYYTREAQDYTQLTQYYTRRAQDYTQRAQDYTQRAQYYTQLAQDSTQMAQYYTREAQYYTREAQDSTQLAQDYTQRAQDYTQRAQYYTQLAQDYTREAQDYTREAQDSTGSLTAMDIDKFITYFFDHPNAYWADKTVERKVEYRQFVEV